MKRLALLLLPFALCACTDRALDLAGGLVLEPVDLAGVDLRGVDLRGVDHAGGNVDLASSAQLGVLCGGTLCQPDQICCPLSGVMGSSCLPSNGAPGGGCGFGMDGYRCDGPEDCAMGRRCVGTKPPGPGLAPTQTRCRMNATMGDVIVCRVDGDCTMGRSCTATMQSQPGAPQLSICQ
jgi:hypothetical protein